MVPLNSRTFFFQFRFSTDQDLSLKGFSTTTEMDHMMRSLDDWQSYTGYDIYLFFSIAVGLLCADSALLQDRLLYEVLRHFCNAIAFMYHDGFCDEVLQRAEEAVQDFATSYKARMGVSACTWKFHVFQHFIRYLRALRASAKSTDSFNMERTLGSLVRSVTTRRNQGPQLIANFLIRWHSEPLQLIDHLDEDVLKFLGKAGAEKRSAARHCVRVRKWLDDSHDTDNDLHDLFMNGAVDSAEYDETEVHVVTRIKIGAITLTSTRFGHKGRIRDHYVLMRDAVAGEVSDIFFVSGPNQSDYYIKVKPYKRFSELIHGPTRRLVRFPRYQFPAEESQDPPKFFKITPELLLMKALRHPRYKWNGLNGPERYYFLAVLSTALL